MDQHQQLLQEMKLQLNRVERKCDDIDLSIKGDDERGVIGMRQNIRLIREKITEHIEDDADQFVAMGSKIDENNMATNKIYWMVAGAAAVVTMVVTIVVTILKYV